MSGNSSPVPPSDAAQADATQSPAAKVGLGCLGIIGGMVCYFVVLAMIGENFISDNTGGAAMLLAIGPYPMIAFVATTVVAFLRKGFLWACAAGALAAIASIVLIKVTYGV